MTRTTTHTLVLLILMTWLEVAQSHPTQYCLMRAAQQAASLKSCAVTQQQAEECVAQQVALNQTKARCTSEEFTPEAIAAAIAHGQDHVKGDSKTSPFQRQQLEQERLASLVAPNQQRFEAFFPAFKDTVAPLVSWFDTADCPQRFQGSGDNWQLVHKYSVERINASQHSELSGQRSQGAIWLLTPMDPKRCYPADPSETLHAQVLNIPQQIIQHLQQLPGNQLVFCDQIDQCLRKQKGIVEQVEEYQQYLAALDRLQSCRGQQKIRFNLSRIWSKAPESSPDDGEECPKSNLETKTLNITEYLQALDQRLFDRNMSMYQGIEGIR